MTMMFLEIIAPAMTAVPIPRRNYIFSVVVTNLFSISWIVVVYWTMLYWTMMDRSSISNWETIGSPNYVLLHLLGSLMRLISGLILSLGFLYP